MASPGGRILRIVLGIVLSIIGSSLFLNGDDGSETLGLIIGVIAIVPILAGVMNWCLIGPLLGAPFNGKDLA
jgi:hypothetical protein